MVTLVEDLAMGWGCAGVRVDTHLNNQPMLGMLGKNGFQLCGIIHLIGGCENGKPRKALEKVIEWN